MYQAIMLEKIKLFKTKNVEVMKDRQTEELFQKKVN